jgi:ATP:ADP antiporter, AAA family
MTGTASEAAVTAQSHLQRFVSVKQDEVAALLASFTMFFTLLCAYCIIRPVRDEMGARIAHDGMQNLGSWCLTHPRRRRTRIGGLTP